MRPNTILMNFRLPIPIKGSFDQICQVKNISMSTQLNLLIREFINTENNKVPETQAKAVPGEPIAPLEDWRELLR